MEADVVYSGIESRHGLFFFASIPAGLNFGRLMFLPQSMDGGISYRQIRQSSDIIFFSAANIQNMMLNFFDDHATVRSEVDTDRYIFRGEHSRATFTWFYIEYTNWQMRGGRITDSLHEALAIALAFMAERDVTLANYVYLHGFERDGSVFRLFFNYIFDDLPVKLTEELRYDLLDGMGAFIEVEVQQGRVSRYQRFAINVEERGMAHGLQISYHDALRGELSELSYGSITGIELVYALGFLNVANLNYSVIADYGDFIIFAGE
jgi:hypothetical protein